MAKDQVLKAMFVSRIPVGSSGRASAKAPWSPPGRLSPPPAPSHSSGRPSAPKTPPGTPRAPACPPALRSGPPPPKRPRTDLPVLQSPAKEPSAVWGPTSPPSQMPAHRPQIKALSDAPKSRLPRRQSSHRAGRLTTASGFGSRPRPAPAHLGKRKEPTESQPRARKGPLATSCPAPSHTPCHAAQPWALTELQQWLEQKGRQLAAIGQELQEKAQQLQKWSPKLSRCSVVFREHEKSPLPFQQEDREEETPMDFQQEQTPMDFQEGGAPLVEGQQIPEDHLNEIEKVQEAFLQQQMGLLHNIYRDQNLKFHYLMGKADIGRESASPVWDILQELERGL